MSKRELYTVNSIPSGGYQVLKFDAILLLPTGQYTVRRDIGKFSCECLASTKPTCRHRELVEIFIDHKILGQQKLYNYDKRTWDPRPAPRLEDDEGDPDYETSKW